MSVVLAALVALNTLQLQFLCEDSNPYVIIQKLRITEGGRTACYEEYIHKQSQRILYKTLSTCSCPKVK